MTPFPRGLVKGSVSEYDPGNRGWVFVPVADGTAGREFTSFDCSCWLQADESMSSGSEHASLALGDWEVVCCALPVLDREAAKITSAN